MASLGQIAEQAGVRPPRSSRNTRSGNATPGAAAGVASGHATGSFPRILEPAPVGGSASSASTVGLEAPAAAAAERSASATDLYQRAIRDAELGGRPQQRESDPVRPVTRSTSTPPDDRISDSAPARQKQHGQQHRAGLQSVTDPSSVASPHLHPPQPVHASNHQQQRAVTRQSSSGQGSDPSPNSDPSPGSHASTSIIPEHHRVYQGSYLPNSASPYGHAIHTPNSASHYSASSSPSYMHHPQHHQQQHPTYAYHTQYYAPQYHYPPPSDSLQQQSYYAVPHAVSPHSPVPEFHSGLAPQTFQPQTYYYSTGQVLHTGASSPNSAVAPSLEDGVHPQSHYAMSDDMSNGHNARPYSSQSMQQVFPGSIQQVQHNHNAQQRMQGGMNHQFAPSQGMQTYVTYNSPHSQGNHVANSHSPVPSPAHPYQSMQTSQMSPMLNHTYTYHQPGGHRSSVDMGQHQYRPVQFAPMGSQSFASAHAQENWGQHHRLSTIDSAFSASTPHSGLDKSSATSPYPPQGFRNSAAGQMQHGPTELARGHLAQSKFREALGAYDPNARLPVSATEKRKAATGDSRLPKPPSHSPWAMWVGNVPSDATHSELWRFFSSRPAPGQPIPGSSEEAETLESEALYEDADQPKPDYSTVGIDSVHLISRSNCCFVNMASKRHLDHAIKVSHGLSLRPHDPRCKPLVCRVRKKDDDNKTGVGAQRGKGMHQAWAAEKEKEKLQAAAEVQGITGEVAGDGASVVSPAAESDIHPTRNGSVSTNHSASTSSTTSSFLQRHFPKRYFILKSHTEDDLHLSVERGLWATQSHNEPVLDQAYRTAQSAFLIFGANKSGEFFGYAKMAGPVFKQEKRTPRNSFAGSDGDVTSPSAIRGSSYTGRKPEPSIPETPEDETTEPIQSPNNLNVPSIPSVLSPSVIVSNSPQPMSNANTPAQSKSVDSKVDYLNVKAPQHNTAPSPICEKDLLKARNASSLDPSVLASLAKMEIKEHGIDLDHHPLSPLGMANAAKTADEQLAAGASSRPGQEDAGVWRKDTALSPQERNARLEFLESEATAAGGGSGSSGDPSLKEAMEQGASKPFKIEWIRVQKLPFYRTRHLRNAFNGNREVKISRDGTEVEPDVGQQLLELFWKDPATSTSLQTSPHTNAASVASPSLS